MKNIKSRLILVKEVGRNKSGRKTGLFRCKCGIEKILLIKDVKSGNTKSCGCLHREIISNLGKITGKTNGAKNKKHGLSGTRFYKIWVGMMRRSYRQKTNKNCYKGITMDSKWLSFDNFYKDMFSGYHDTLTLDRIDSAKGYFKENCRWATVKEQARNTKQNIWIKYKGKNKLMVEWADELKIKPDTLRARIYNYGWTIEKAFNTPVNN